MREGLRQGWEEARRVERRGGGVERGEERVGERGRGMRGGDEEWVDVEGD